MPDCVTIRIEPQWNVNEPKQEYFEEQKPIRIEPQWNVNLLTKSKAEKSPKLEQNHSGM